MANSLSEEEIFVCGFQIFEVGLKVFGRSERGPAHVVKSADVIVWSFSLNLYQIENITFDDFVFEVQAVEVAFKGEVLAGCYQDMDGLIPKRGFTPKRGSFESFFVLGVPTVIVTFDLFYVQSVSDI